jgi:hypothetical protein
MGFAKYFSIFGDQEFQGLRADTSRDEKKARMNANGSSAFTVHRRRRPEARAISHIARSRN